MIRSFRSKSLKGFWDRAELSGVGQSAERIKRILSLLNAASLPAEMNLPGLHFRKLHGHPTRYSVRVTGNLRVTFEWDEMDALRVDLEDYH
jgi:proteic killer suppression protein